jgi:cellulose synthase/poly-beta-1,6-N-acetylglucosamine synthase-like glycosyltransferase
MSTLQWVLLIYAVFLVYFVTLHLLYLVLIGLGIASNQLRNRERRATDLEQIRESELTVPISVIVPAFNESTSILDTAESALASRFPEFEVIVVDDGSTDDTLAQLRDAFDLRPHVRNYTAAIPTTPVRRLYQSRRDPRLWVIAKENGGKSDACNAGLNLARYRYVLMTDADVVFDPDALTRMVRLINFDPGRIVGLGVTLRALNGCRVESGRVVDWRLPPEWVVRFQVMEYSSVFLANRLGWSALNAVPVLSGGGSAWRKDAVREIGGFSTDVTHEDMDATLRMHRHFRRAKRDYRIVYMPDPVIWTEVPHTWRDLYKQRKRWQRTMYESVWRARPMWFNPRYGTVGMLQMPYLLLYEGLGPFLELLSYALTIVLLLLGFVDRWLLVAFLVLAAGLNALIRLVSLTIDLVFYERYTFRDVLRLSAAAFLEFWTYRPFLLLARVQGFFEFLGGRRVHERAERQPRSNPPQTVTAA